jgi:hypothetical protein
MKGGVGADARATLRERPQPSDYRYKFKMV